MDKKEFDEMIDEIIEICFEVDTGDYYCDRCIEFDHLIEILSKRIRIKKSF